MTKAKKKPDDLLTVFSDASVKDDFIGCGYWFRGLDQVRSASGGTALYRPNTNSTQAELWGIWFALHRATEFFKRVEEGSYNLLVQCDNLGALQALMHLDARWARNSLHQTPKARKHLGTFEMDLINKIAAMQFRVIYLKHVKGHRIDGTTRSYVNQRTDRLAAQAIEKLKNEIYEQKDRLTKTKRGRLPGHAPVAES